MTDSFLDNAGGYTPVPDKLVREYDFTTAYIWGKVWRYCQMENGTCTASHETIAKRAGMSRRTLIDKLDQLIEDGYIEDLTPNLKNRPHTYCTKKCEEKIKSSVQNLHSELDESANITQPEEPTMQDLHPDYAEFAQPTMQNLHLKKDSLESLKETPNGVGKKPEDKTTPLWQLMNEFVRVTGIQMPHNANRKKDWWGSIREIYETANRDVDVGKRLIRDAIEEARQGKWSVSRPGSLVNTVGRLMAEGKQKVVLR